jgi:nucleoside-diphosphate-sugar epimerase
MTDDRPTLLVTGAAGYVAGLIMPGPRRHYQLRRLDVVGQQPEADDEVVPADVCDIGLVIEACQGVAGVVHLAAKAFEDDFLSILLPRNVMGTWPGVRSSGESGRPEGGLRRLMRPGRQRRSLPVRARSWQSLPKWP